MAKPKYARSKGQVLHRYEPGAVATTSSGTAEIKKHFARRQDKLSRDLREAIEQELSRWRHFDSQMRNFIEHKADLVPVDISSVTGRRLNVRECAKCGAIRNVETPQWRTQPDAPCHHCGNSNLYEVPFVFAHADGTMVQLTPEPCPDHGYEFLILERTARKRWRCKVLDCKYAKEIRRALASSSIMRQEKVREQVKDATSNEPSGMMTLSAVSDKKLQVVHSISRIDPTPNINRFQSQEKHLDTLLAIYLGYVNWQDKSLTELIEALRALGQGSELDQKELQQTLETLMLMGLSEDKIQQFVTEKQKLQERDAGGPVVAELRQALNTISPNVLQLLRNAQEERETRDHREPLQPAQENARTLHEQLINRGVILDLKRENINDAAHRLAQLGSPFSMNLETARDDMRSKLGITQVEVIQNLPVMHIAYGYTRLSHQPEAAVLWAFDRDAFDLASDEPQGNWIPAPIYKLQTEALSFQFDSARIVRWLNANNLVTEDESEAFSEPTVWLLKRHSRIDSRSGPAFKDLLDLSFLIPWLVGSAIHSATHLMIRAIADQSSFGETALSEHLLLSLNQTIIFVNRLQEFSLGGLKTFFEQRLDQAFKSLLEERGDCMFDPYCEETLGGACAGCLHLPEVVCRLFNNALSRILLYGGDLRTEIEGDGSERTLWKPNLQNFTKSSDFIGLWDRNLD